MNEQLTVKSAIKETLPTVFGYVGIGMAFGIIGRESGFSPVIVLLMSLFIYAGSAQFTTVSMLSGGSPVLSIILATFLVNSRMILMSTTLTNYFKNAPLRQNILLGTLLTDESFALSMNKQNYTRGQLNFTWMNTANLIAYLTWVLSSVIGALLGGIVADPKVLGLDFAIVAMFMGLVYLQVICDKSLKHGLQLLVIVLTCVLTYLALILLPANIVIIVVTLFGCSLGVWCKHAFF